MERLKKYLKKNYNKIIIFIIMVLGVLILISAHYTTNTIKFNVKNMKNAKYFDEIIEKQNEVYKNFLDNKNEIITEKPPYLIDGFSYMEGTIETGYVINDKNGNEFVWVPCSNVKNDYIIKLSKRDFNDEIFITYGECYDDIEHNKFFSSVLENKGFYISRYEIGMKENQIVSKKDAELINNVSAEEANKIAKEMYENVNSELINGYAYDTAIEWIIRNNKIDIVELNRYSNSKSKIITGVQKYNNIYDIFDSIGEITSEKYYNQSIYRTTFAENDIEISGLFEEENMIHERILLDKEERYPNIGFRTILYK